jgi:hypothetical protein
MSAMVELTPFSCRVSRRRNRRKPLPDDAALSTLDTRGVAARSRTVSLSGEQGGREVSTEAFEETQRLFGADHVAVAGEYVFADLAELDAVTAKWTALRDAIQEDGELLRQAQILIYPPAEDDMSRQQPHSVVESLAEAVVHNEAMVTSTQSCLDKLTAARDLYVSEDATSVSRLRSIDAG